MALVPMTPEQRAVVLEKAQQARAVRAEAKIQLRTGVASLGEVLARAQEDAYLGKMKVLTALEALPGVGRATALSVMEELSIADNRRLRGLGHVQIEALAKRFG